MKVEIFPSDIMDENCYALIGDNDIALIDVGSYTFLLAEFVEKNKDKIKYILLTHRHFDHILGVAEVLKKCPFAKTVIHSSDALGLSNADFSLARVFGLPQEPVCPDILCKAGDTVLFENKSITVLHTPGHTAGSVCYLVNDMIFTGDTLFKGSVGRTDFESGNPIDMKKSLNLLNSLSGNYLIFTGHGPKTTLSFEKANNPYLQNFSEN